MKDPRAYSQQNYLPVNECGVITIYPMVIDCIPIPPLENTLEGSLTLLINGGTPPYTVTVLDNITGSPLLVPLQVNSKIRNIPNLAPGTYFILITDSFGDFQQLINCTIPGAVTTTTTTALPIPSEVPNYLDYSFCIRVVFARQVGKKNNTYSVYVSFRVLGFTYINGVIIPIFISSDNYNIISWDNSINQWSLSASTSSELTTYLGDQSITNWSIVNSQPLPIAPSSFTNSNRPINGWNIITDSEEYINPTISSQKGACSKSPQLNLIINESWWQYYNSNLPSQYRGDVCGDNETPYFIWEAINLPSGVSATTYDILCVRVDTMDVYWDVTGITQTAVSSTIPWSGSPTINPTIGVANSEGWTGPCNLLVDTATFKVTLTANLSDMTTLTASINFIYCQNVINNVCTI